MATQKQIEANRQNALKSTGPKSEAGKAASSANALSHGLSASLDAVLPDEDADAFERLRQGVIADLAPAGALQGALAERVAVLLWRLDRAARLEAQLFVHGQFSVVRNMGDRAFSPRIPLPALMDVPEESKQLRKRFEELQSDMEWDMHAEAPNAQVLVECRENARAFDQLARHEATLQRALNRTLAEFRHLRDAAAVRAEANAAPAAAPTDPEPVPDADSDADAVPAAVTDPGPEPADDARTAAPQGARGPAGESPSGAAHDGEEEILQNEANSAQTLESAYNSEADAGPLASPPVA